MKTIEKINTVLLPTEVRKIKADLMLAVPEFNSQDVNEDSFCTLTELISVNSRLNLDRLQKETWKIYGGSGMVTVYQAIDELTK